MTEHRPASSPYRWLEMRGNSSSVWPRHAGLADTAPSAGEADKLVAVVVCPGCAGWMVQGERPLWQFAHLCGCAPPPRRGFVHRHHVRDGLAAADLLLDPLALSGWP